MFPLSSKCQHSCQSSLLFHRDLSRLSATCPPSHWAFARAGPSTGNDLSLSEVILPALPGQGPLQLPLLPCSLGSLMTSAFQCWTVCPHMTPPALQEQKQGLRARLGLGTGSRNELIWVPLRPWLGMGPVFLCPAQWQSQGIWFISYQQGQEWEG